MPHNGALLITLRVLETDVKRVLIDPSSSTNIIQLQVVKEIQMTSQIIQKARSLFEFDNSSVVIRGKVILHIFTEGIVKDTTFQVVMADITYNIILGILYIHYMDTIPSMLHHVI